MKNDWRQAGFSLPELMIGTAIVAGLTLGGIEIFKKQSEAAKLVQVRTDLDDFHRKLTKTLVSFRNCNANFYTYFGAATIASAQLASLVQCCPGMTASCTLATVVPPAVNTQCTPGYTFAGNISPLVTANQKIENKAHSFTFVSATLRNEDDTANNVTKPAIAPFDVVKKGQIKVVYQLQSKLAGIKDIVKTIPVQFKFTAAGNFVSCTDDAINTKNTLQRQLCAGLSPNLVYYDEATDTCKRNDTSLTHTCSGTQVLVGLDSNGDEICQSPESAFDETQAIDSTNATGCDTGTNVSFVWEGYPVNKIKVICSP